MWNLFLCRYVSTPLHPIQDRKFTLAIDHPDRFYFGADEKSRHCRRDCVYSGRPELLRESNLRANYTDTWRTFDQN